MSELPTKVFTLCIIHKNDQILLGLKKQKIGAGLWNGFGGRVEEGETIEEAARREVKEEIGVEVTDLEKLGVNTFRLHNFPEILEVHIFKARDFKGELIETDEMGLPKWFPISEIPYEKMWSDDIHWLPFFLADKKFKGDFTFDAGNKVAAYHLEENINIV